VAGSRTQDWNLTTESITLVWHNSHTWVKQTPKVTVQGPASGNATGSLLDHAVTADDQGYLLIQN
jgi:hypothetical protein